MANMVALRAADVLRRRQREGLDGTQLRIRLNELTKFVRFATSVESGESLVAEWVITWIESYAIPEWRYSGRGQHGSFDFGAPARRTFSWRDFVSTLDDEAIEQVVGDVGIIKVSVAQVGLVRRGFAHGVDFQLLLLNAEGVATTIKTTSRGHMDMAITAAHEPGLAPAGPGPADQLRLSTWHSDPALRTVFLYGGLQSEACRAFMLDRREERGDDELVTVEFTENEPEGVPEEAEPLLQAWAGPWPWDAPPMLPAGADVGRGDAAAPAP